MPAGMSDLRGAARFSVYSRMRVESISTVPSSHTSEGALTTGLIRRNCSKVLKTEIDRCSNGRPSNWSDTATRRTYGESSIPMSCINPRADGSRALAQEDVGRTFARDALRAFIAQSTEFRHYIPRCLVSGMPGGRPLIRAFIPRLSDLPSLFLSRK